MTTFNALLVATDLSVDGNNAVHRAAQLAHAHGARLDILHVLPPVGFKPLREWFKPTLSDELKAAQAGETLHRLSAEVLAAHGVVARSVVEWGDPLSALMRAADRADLVVLGQRGRRLFSAWRAGKTVDRMLSACRRPILVVKAPFERPYQRVLTPIAFTACSDMALEVAARVSGAAGAHVFHALHSQREAALRDSDAPEHVIQEARTLERAGTLARMQRKVARLGLDHSRMAFDVAYGAAVDLILRQARTLNADLVVAGKHGLSTAGGFLLGRVSGRLLHGCDCDLLIVPRSRGATLPHDAWVHTPRPKVAARPRAAAMACVKGPRAFRLPGLDAAARGLN